MTQEDLREETDSRLRATAVRHAHNIQDKKLIQTRIADLIIEAFDLPQSPIADPAHPDPFEALRFKQCLKLFQTSDFDDLVTERNIDDRCGYTLCSRPNIKVKGGERLWNGRGGKDFGIVPKTELQKWCSKECGDRALFVQEQLGKEPAWVRNTPVENIRLLDEVRLEAQMRISQSSKSTEIIDHLQKLNLQDGEGYSKDGLADRLHELALERGELLGETDRADVKLVEKSPALTKVSEPPTFHLDDVDMIEGHQTRRVRFAEDDSDRSDDEMSD